MKHFYNIKLKLRRKLIHTIEFWKIYPRLIYEISDHHQEKEIYATECFHYKTLNTHNNKGIWHLEPLESVTQWNFHIDKVETSGEKKYNQYKMPPPCSATRNRSSFDHSPRIYVFVTSLPSNNIKCCICFSKLVLGYETTLRNQLN